MNEIESYFHKLRFDKNHHLGLGDIRLTIAQQDELVALFEQKLNIHGVMQAEGSDGAEGAAVGNSAAGKGVSDGKCEKCSDYGIIQDEHGRNSNCECHY